MKLEQIYKDIIKEVKLIPEIGEGSSQPFDYQEDFRDGRNFSYYIKGKINTPTGDLSMGINLQGIGVKFSVNQEDGQWIVNGYEEPELGKFLNVDPGSELEGFEITFSHASGGAFSLVNDKTYMFRLMATIKEILQKEFNESNPDFIMYSPTKQGEESIDQTGRHKLYDAFIKKAFPNARMFVDRGMEEIIYKLK